MFFATTIQLDFMLLSYILIIAGAPTVETSSSVDTGTVIGGSIASVITMLFPITACLIYYKRRSSALHKRYTP